MEVLCIMESFASEGWSVPELGPDAGILPFLLLPLLSGALGPK